MKLKTITMAVAAVTAGFALSASAGVVKTEGEDIIISTKKGGLELKTESGDFSFKISGKLQWDYASYDDLYAGIAKTNDKGRKGYIRRAEVGFSGKAYGDWKYKISMENKDDTIKLDDAKITYTAFKPVDVTVGRWGRDYGLENTVSSSWIMGIERSMMYDFLQGGEGNNYGIEFATGGDNYTAVFGVHNDDQTDEKTGEERLASYVVRGTFAPIMEDNMLVHLGLNYYNKNPDAKNKVTLETSLGLKKGYKLAFDVEKVKSDSEYLVEAAAQFQSLQLQAEYAVRNLKSDNANSDVTVSAYYAQASYMLDGGRRSYKDGAFGSPKGGQWEIFGRYSDVNLDIDNATDDVKLSSYTLGVNYFPTKNIRASLNYVSGKLDNNAVTADQNDKGSAVVGRLQYVF